MKVPIALLGFVAVLGCSGDSGEFLGDGSESLDLVSVAAGITVESLMAETEVLASDGFGGRAPGAPGEALTIEYLTDQFSTLGLLPGNPDGTWVQRVPLVGITPQDGDRFRVSKGNETLILEPGKDYVSWTKHVSDEVLVDAEFVFVGPLVGQKQKNLLGESFVG